MTHVTAVDISAKFPNFLRKVRHGERFVVRNGRGKDVAALVPMEEYEAFERWVEAEEDRIDNEECDKRLAEIKATGDKGIPIEDVKKRLGIL
jgi:prevent-host-death family protein